MMYLKRLKDLREDANLNQQDVANILGIRQNVYSRYEIGLRTLPMEHLIKLAAYYGTTTDYILGVSDLK